MRCLALGQAWQTLGYGDVTLLSVSLPDAFAERARSEGFGIERVAANAPGSAEDVEGTLAAVG
ncbi:MAG: UDP-2,4-diacetamido-2,4,6-trideoxy-beta-L-altropyranose hydrolase, partial [Myxococcota bacterium]